MIELLIEQLNSYFAGARQTFTVPTRLIGTDFQQHVWRFLANIPYSETTYYEQFAEQVYSLSYTRAVSSNLGKNPLPILYPCHRVVAKQLRSGGFAGGMELKNTLLQLEHSFRQNG